MERAMLGVIGGTGLEEPGIIEDAQEIEIETPYGRPSAPLMMGKLGGRPVAFMRRHGVKHEYAPHIIPYRANLWAMRAAGVTGIIAVATVGAISESIDTGDLMVPDQLLDYTWGREHTYYGTPEAGVKHIDFTYPFDEGMRVRLTSAANRLGRRIAGSGCYACTQGPRLETAAEIRRFRRDGADVVGMTAYPECALARELEIPYAVLCVSVNAAAGIRESAQSIRFDELKAVVDRAVLSAVKVVSEAARAF